MKINIEIVIACQLILRASVHSVIQLSATISYVRIGQHGIDSHGKKVSLSVFHTRPEFVQSPTKTHATYSNEKDAFFALHSVDNLFFYNRSNGCCVRRWHLGQ